MVWLGYVSVYYCLKLICLGEMIMVICIEYAICHTYGHEFPIQSWLLHCVVCRMKQTSAAIRYDAFINNTMENNNNDDDTRPLTLSLSLSLPRSSIDRIVVCR